MSAKLTRLVLAACLAAGFAVAPMLGAGASERTIRVEDGQFNLGQKNFDVYLQDVVAWELAPGAKEKHSVAPANGHPGGNTWPPDAKPSGELKAGEPFKFTFTKPGRFFYFCEYHPDTMKDYYIDVIDPNATTTTTAAPVTTTTAAPTTTTTRAPGVTTPTTAAPASSAGTKPPVTAAPAPTTTTAAKDKDKKGKDDKKDEETTTTTLPPPPPVDIPDSAIIPALPDFGSTGTTTQNGIEAPDGAPEGDAIALLKSKKGGSGKAMKLLIVSGLGLGALGIGTAGYKYANRSSKYFPA